MSTKLALTSGGGVLYPEDVFSSYTYAGNGSARSINNGLNLSAFGGMVWIKQNNLSGNPHFIFDSVRGADLAVSPTAAYNTGNTTYSGSVTGYNSNGFALGNQSFTNSAGSQYVAWAFRRAQRFFDVVTYTGTGSARTVAHSLGVAPGFILVKRTDATANFAAYHANAGAGKYFDVNAAAAPSNYSAAWNLTAPTSSVFTVGIASETNALGGTFVAYLFAHDALASGVIQCGSYIGGGTGAGPTVTLGWEPQFLLIKGDSTANWVLVDGLRGLAINAESPIFPNTTGSQSSMSGQVQLLPTGFRMLAGATEFNVASTTYYYVAIRRPMRRPTAGTQVFSPHTFTGNNTATNIDTPGFPADMVIGRATTGTNIGLASRVHGALVGLFTNLTNAQSTSTAGNDLTSFANVLGYQAGASSNFTLNGSSTPQANYAFKRAPGFFEVVAYSGTGAAQALAHSLGVAPEMMLVFRRDTAANRFVYHSALGNTKHMILNSSGTTNALPVTDSTSWNNTSPTATQFTVGTNASTNASGGTYIAFLFASLSGISKVGSYTGNGSTLAIDCGFATGARFVLIKRFDTTGPATNNYTNNWLIADTARGIGASNDPVACLNTTAADSTSIDWLSANSAGFNVIQTSNTDTNVNGATYIYLAIA